MIARGIAQGQNASAASRSPKEFLRMWSGADAEKTLSRYWINDDEAVAYRDIFRISNF